ncbi:MAG: DUF1731 domain-containing protein [Phycisphaeraceae bacterium]|nr:DUF1731 domain-containing protein [Phycisphaeraceae bacterium]
MPDAHAVPSISIGNDRASRRVVIAGGSGFLGHSLAAYLHGLGYGVTVLPRRPLPPGTPWQHQRWDARTLGTEGTPDDWSRVLDSAFGLINLTGRTVDCIKTPDHCDQILRSRIESTLVLGEAMRRVPNPPGVWVQMSTAHIYGDPSRETVCDEDSPTGYGLAPIVGRAWEESFASAKPAACRGVVLRTSFVVGRRNPGGAWALGRLGLLARLGLVGTVGTGTQGMSWIHELDMNRLFERGLTDPSMSGVYVASSPNPVDNREFMRELRRAVGMPIGLPAMSWMVRLAAPLFLKTDPELALYGRYVVSKRLKAEGFAFRCAELGPALSDLYRRSKSAQVHS